MHLVFDAKRAFVNGTGLGQYARAHLRMVAQHLGGQAITLCSPFSRMPSFEEEMKEAGANIVFVGKGAFWRSKHLPKIAAQSAATAFHALSPELPSGIQAPTIVTLHDLIPFENPAYHRFPDVFLYKLKSSKALTRADKIVSVSARTAHVATRFFPSLSSKIEVIPPVFSPAPDWNAQASTGYAKPYILYVGSQDLRKNIGTLLRAFAASEIRRDFSLVLVGPLGSMTRSWREFARNMEMEDQVHFAGSVSEAQKAAWYRGAQAVVYPSLVEGFGLPVLEALYFQKPVLTVQDSSMEEAGGPLAHYFPGLDVGAWTRGLNSIPHLAPPKPEALHKHLRQFSTEALWPAWKKVYGLS